jgi:hypothetical protein
VQKSLRLLNALADSAAAKGVHILVVSFPQCPDYKATQQIGRLGPSWTTYTQIETWLKNLENSNNYFHFYDAHMNGNHDYTASDAYDCNHLSFSGAVKLSTRIDSVIQTFLP